MIDYSLIVPTRGRPEEFVRLLDSLAETARRPETIEVIAVLDEDDASPYVLSHPELVIHEVRVPSGLPMGQLNCSGAAAARGCYLMLLNDDVIVKTAGWDEEIRSVIRQFADGIVLIHVNDLLFRDSLCTFPLMPRQVVSMLGGICPGAYRRYCIDNHIQDIFDRLQKLGYARRVFLPDVIFEHHHHSVSDLGSGAYRPDRFVWLTDHETYLSLAEARTHTALRCARQIESQLPRRPFRTLYGRKRRHEPGYLVWQSGNLTFQPKPAACAAPVRKHGRIVRMLALLWPAQAGSYVVRDLFDPAWYRQQYGLHKARLSELLRHYLRYGGFQGFKPNPHFDSAWYLRVNADVTQKRLNPLLHYVLFGVDESRDPNPWFDSRYYLSENPQAAETATPLHHFLQRGLFEGRSPCPGYSLAEYLQQVGGCQPAVCTGAEPAPLSVIVPTRNRRSALARLLEFCQQYAPGAGFEMVVVDDGSTDDTVEFLKAKSSSLPWLRWISVSPGGPARARNLGAVAARYPILLFINDDVFPSDTDFFRSHARLHSGNPDPCFAVLGQIDWPQHPDFPTSTAMAAVKATGYRFAFDRLAPGTFADWRFFYTANVSVKKDLTTDWLRDGFDERFTRAAFEDTEFAYRHSRRGLKVYYDPTSLGWHDHPFSAQQFLERQLVEGSSLSLLVAIHPELAEPLGVAYVDRALKGAPRRKVQLGRVMKKIQSIFSQVQGLDSWQPAQVSEKQSELLCAIFEMALHYSYALARYEQQSGDLAGALDAILRRFSRHMQPSSRILQLLGY